ncbi:MAG TPA: ABC transporter ATP-binding protein [Bryobacteraceae bacterium]|nr:ABC transporter ATP-binding protein [Bryobacteraceae bacterium]
MWESLRTLRKYLWRYRWGMAMGFVCLTLKDLAVAGQPLLIRRVIDELSVMVRGGAAAAGARSLALRFVAYMAVLALFKAIFQYGMRVIIIGISRNVEYDLRNDLFQHLIGLSPDYFGRTRTGDIMARATNDLNAVRMMLGPAVMYCFETSLTFALAIAIMVSVDWRLALLSLAPAPVVSLIVLISGRAIHTRFQRIQAIFSDISSRVQENLSGVRMVRAFAQEQAEIRRFEELNRHYIAQNLNLVRIDAIFEPLMEMLIGLTFLVVLWIGGHQVLEGRLSLGGFVMFNTFMGLLVWPMIALGWVVNLMQRGTASLGRINQILRERPTIHAPREPQHLAHPLGRIEFHGVSMDYGSGPALASVDLSIPAGATIAVVGRTGCGKSTLVNLVPRLMDPTDGRITLDGIELRDLDPADLRRHIGFVPQETFLFSATIAENIAFGVDTATAEEIRNAADIAGLATDIEGFPAGYETMVGERGITLSGGQKQRTAIARAILRNPRILILDDALSSVDTLTEERILTRLAGVMAGRTVILISHRVSTVRQADRIVVLENGRIVEEGTHAELIESGGYYAELSQKQMLEEELEAI